jgi:hypothetical protein
MVWQVLQDALMITAFVAVMMLAVEYVNVFTRGVLMTVIGDSRLWQYLLAVLLGATPGCLGAYVVVALYSHRRITLGALVAGMIATTGDEAFVMLALFPCTALVLTGGLAVLGLAAGWVTDWAAQFGQAQQGAGCCSFDLHLPDTCRCYPRGEILTQWRPPSAQRAILAVVLALFSASLAVGQVGPLSWGWRRVTLLLVVGFGLFVVATVPDHFLDEHLWRHVALKHVPQIFGWTLGALAVLALLEQLLGLRSVVAANGWAVLGMSGLVGVIPGSGPHLLFVTLYADGALPPSVLLANSAVQDGHGMLPLLAHSRRDFARVKLVNLLVGLGAGSLLMALGA